MITSCIIILAKGIIACNELSNIAMSNLKKLKSELESMEITSDACIPQENHYIILIRPTDLTKMGQLQKLASKELLQGKNQFNTTKPLITYYYDGKVTVAYSCSNNKPHHLNGSYCKLLSTWCSTLAIIFQCTVNCNIVQFETRTRLLTYLMHQAYENLSNTFIILGRGLISSADVSSLTEVEIKDKLKNIGVDWKGIPLKDKYGVFYKVGNKGIIEKKSLRPSISNIETYRDIVFG